MVTAAAKEMDAPASVASVRSLQSSRTSHCIMFDQPSMLLPDIACLCPGAEGTPKVCDARHLYIWICHYGTSLWRLPTWESSGRNQPLSAFVKASPCLQSGLKSCQKLLWIIAACSEEGQWL